MKTRRPISHEEIEKQLDDALEYDEEKTLKVLQRVSKIFGWITAVLLILFVISSFTTLIHPLFWIALFFGSYGVYGTAVLRSENIKEKIKKRNDGGSYEN